jgi:hypothetical protein
MRRLFVALALLLYLTTFLPYAANYTLPEFPPCECDLATGYCICVNDLERKK